jgi:DNA-binding transcriptional MerR regulator
MMYIGELARLSGATRKAIRHYEAVGLIPAPARKGKYRMYSEQDVDVIRMIRRAQSLGFKLVELKEIVPTKISRGKFPLDMANALINKKRDMLRGEMEKLEAADRDLVVLQQELQRNCE